VTFEATIPLETVNPLNRREFWAARAKRARNARASTFYALKQAKAPHALPLTVTVTRIAPRPLDGHDGLPASLKGVVDGIADYLLLKSDADPRLTIRYAQERAGVREYGVRITMEAA
jgi:hypothetical protein